jgi:hypothetical protein
MQNIIAILIVASATSYLGWRSWQTIAAQKKSTGCGSCGSCQANGEAGLKITPLVTLQPQKIEPRADSRRE